MPLTVIAKFQAKPGSEPVVKDKLQGMLTPSRSEIGCLNYDVFQANDDAAVFFTYENWTGKDALNAHMQTPHFKDLDTAFKELLARPMDIDLLTQYE